MMMHRWRCYAAPASDVADQTLPSLALPGTVTTRLLRAPRRALRCRTLLRHRTLLRRRTRFGTGRGTLHRRTLLRHGPLLRTCDGTLDGGALLRGRRTLLRHRPLLRTRSRTLRCRPLLRGRALLLHSRTLLRHRPLLRPLLRGSRSLVARRQLLAHVAVADLRHVLRHLAACCSGTCTGGTRTRALVAALSLPFGTVVATLTRLHAARTTLRIDGACGHRP